MTMRIRKGSFTEELYLDPAGQWGPWAVAAKFTTNEAADNFAARHGIADHGVFTYQCGPLLPKESTNETRSR